MNRFPEPATNKYWTVTEILAALVVFSALFFFLDMDRMIFSGPGGIHFMRQTDSLSFTVTYYNEGFHFFRPELFNLKNTDARAACEFPLIYYITALIYLITGVNFSVLKILNFLIAITGIFFTYKTAVLILKDRILAIFTALIPFSSTVFNYYALNYLPDTSAFGFIMTGWYFFFRYYYGYGKRNIIPGFIFFCLGSLIKVTYLINPLAILFFYLLKAVTQRGKTVPGQTITLAIAGLVTTIAVVAWNIYMIMYNRSYESISFNTTAMPIWKISSDEIAIVWDHFTNYWYSSYFAKPVFTLLYIVFALQLIFIKKTNLSLLLLSSILLAGCMAFFILFYSQFRDHDYYFLTFFPMLLLVLINGIGTLKNLLPGKIPQYIIKLAFLIVILSGINYASSKLKSRYANSRDDYSKAGLIIQQDRPDLNSLGIDRNAKLIVAPDLTQNGGLLMIDRKGWNIERTGEITTERIKHLKKEGAEYLLLATDEKEILETGYKSGEIIYTGKELSIFRLE